MNNTFKDISTRIQIVIQKNRNKITNHDILSALTEELGEYSRAVRVEERAVICNNKTITESSYVEAVDIILVAIEAYIVRGGKLEELYEVMDRKLSKWEKLWEKQNDLH